LKYHWGGFSLHKLWAHFEILKALWVYIVYSLRAHEWRHGIGFSLAWDGFYSSSSHEGDIIHGFQPSQSFWQLIWRLIGLSLKVLITRLKIKNKFRKVDPCQLILWLTCVGKCYRVNPWLLVFICKYKGIFVVHYVENLSFAPCRSVLSLSLYF